MSSQSDQNDTAAQIIKLSNLHADGVLTDDEFVALKARLIAEVSNRSIETVSGATKPKAVEGLFGENPAVLTLIGINVGIFGFMLLGNPALKWNAAYLVSWGADYGRLTLSGEMWRLFTATFIHISVLHIVTNMSCLFYWGRITERSLGIGPFVLIYLLSGVFASLMSVLVNPQVVSAGASGSIAGVLGIMCIMWFRGDKRVTTEDVLGNLAVNVMLSFVGGVDWVAHVCGLVGGLILAALFLQADSRVEEA